MANSKKFEATKKDMNFFSAFTSSAGQVGSYLSLILLVMLGFIIIGGGIYAFMFLQTATIQNNIAELNAKMQSEAYQTELAKYSELNTRMASLNQQYYDVSALFAQVQNTSKVESSYMDTIYSSVPADIIITDFEYINGAIVITGSADSYYSPLDMIANFSKADLFTTVSITNISQIPVTMDGLSPEDLALIKKYTFTMEGFIEKSYPVLISKLVDNTSSTPLTASKSQTVADGGQYTESGVNKFTAGDGTVYALSRVLVNNAALPEAEMAAIRQSDTISGTVIASSVDIKLFYTISSTTGGAQ